MAPVVNFCASSCSSGTNPQFLARAQSFEGGNSTVLSSDPAVVHRTSFFGKKKEKRISVDGGNGRSKSIIEKSWEKEVVSKDLQALWDDGYGMKTLKDYLDGAKKMIKPDGGPPRWFCPVECGQSSNGSPVLLYCPGIGGVGLGLTPHHKALGKVFEVRCLHIPVFDRTPFEGLVKFVEETVRIEHAVSPNKPIYVVGESFGGCIALSVAARNPKIDLVLILANPATSFDRCQLQPLFPLFEALPDELYTTIPDLFNSILGNPMKMAMIDLQHRLPSRVQVEQLARNLAATLPSLSGLSDMIQKDTLLWKLKLLKSAAAYANSRLHAVKAEVLVISSGRDLILPSADEAQRLNNLLENCKVRYFKEKGHTILLEHGIDLLAIIKGTGKYRTEVFR